MGTVIGQFLLILLGGVAELLFLLTGKWLLLLISGGRLLLMPPDAPSNLFRPFKRLPCGQVGVDRQFAILIAALFWSLMLVLYLAYR